MDPLQVPIKTILPPFEVHRHADFSNEEDPRKPNSLEHEDASKVFSVPLGLLNSLDYCESEKDQARLSLQVRCI